jgi:hypothetical protein
MNRQSTEQAAEASHERSRKMSTPLEQTQRHPLVQQLKEFYSGFSLDTITALDAIYTQDVEFRDPVHTMHGCLAVKAYMRRMATNMTHYRIHYVDELVGSNSAYLTWEMEVGHPRLKGGKPFLVRGMTQIKFTGKVYYHEDSYDLGALVYEQVPVLGVMARGLKQRLAG